MIDILCRKVIQQLNINVFVETGTDKGETVATVSRWYADMFPEYGTVISVSSDGSRSYNLWNAPIEYPIFGDSKQGSYQIHTVDLDEHSYQKAKCNFKNNCNIYVHHNSSERFLRKFLFERTRKANIDDNYLFFLDAHWGKYWPLRDEILSIRKLPKSIVIIDDFFVPGKSNPSFPHGAFGFDVYQSRILSWSYIADLFHDKDVRVFYPLNANRDQRGWVMIFTGYADHEIDFLNDLPIFELEHNHPAHAKPVKTTFLTYLDWRNLIKTFIPLTLLRALNRFYEKYTTFK